MATRLLATTICDRCQRVIGQQRLDTDVLQALPAPGPDAKTLRITITKPRVGLDPEVTIVVEYTDLCTTCDPAVTNILARLKLEDELKPAAAESAPSTPAGTGTPPVAAHHRTRKAKEAPAASSTPATTPPVTTTPPATSPPVESAPVTTASTAAPVPSPPPPVAPPAVEASPFDDDAGPSGAPVDDPNAPF